MSEDKNPSTSDLVTGKGDPDPDGPDGSVPRGNEGEVRITTVGMPTVPAPAPEKGQGDPLPPPPGGDVPPGRTLTGELGLGESDSSEEAKPGPMEEALEHYAGNVRPAAEDSAGSRDSVEPLGPVPPAGGGGPRSSGGPVPGAVGLDPGPGLEEGMTESEDGLTPVYFPDSDSPWDHEDLIVTAPVDRVESADFALEQRANGVSPGQSAIGSYSRDSIDVITEAVNMESESGVWDTDEGIIGSGQRGSEAQTFDDARRGAIPTPRGADSGMMDEPSTEIWGGQADPPSKPSNVSVRRHTIPRPGGDLIGGRYRIVKRIGVGGMARIYKVVHEDLGKAFALKIIHTALSEDPRMREMFDAEARMASSMDHPNIVQVTDFGEDPDYGAYIVMEYLQGETLRARLRREKKLHVNLACEIVAQMADALRSIHARDVVHCDIKSDNIFLCRVPQEQRRALLVKLLDFGLSRVHEGSGVVSLSDVGGTPAYMAPERIRRSAPRPGMDIYSLGVLFYEMLTGTLPFRGEMDEILMAHLNEIPKPPSSRLDEPLDERVDEIVMKALEKEPGRRQKDMGAFLYEVRTLMNMLGIRTRRRPTSSNARTIEQDSTKKRKVFDQCPLPLFQLDSLFNITEANGAFGTFVKAPVDQVKGRPLAETRLGLLCPEVLDDAQAVMKRNRKSQRVITFSPSSKKQVSTMIWLVPDRDRGKVVGVIGVIHPIKL